MEQVHRAEDQNKHRFNCVSSRRFQNVISRNTLTSDFHQDRSVQEHAQVKHLEELTYLPGTVKIYEILWDISFITIQLSLVPLFLRA